MRASTTSLDHAGVGVGTAYRRFPNKEALIDEIFEERIREIVAVLERALDLDDPWQGLQMFIADLLRFQAEDRGLKQAFHQRDESRERLTESKARLQPMITELIERSQAAGKLRADVSPTDVMVGVMMLGNVIDATRDVSPDAWGRYLVLVLDGLAAGRDAATELPGEPLTPEQFDEALHCSQS